jgi:hypothetical protein
MEESRSSAVSLLALGEFTQAVCVIAEVAIPFLVFILVTNVPAPHQSLDAKEMRFPWNQFLVCYNLPHSKLRLRLIGAHDSPSPAPLCAVSLQHSDPNTARERHLSKHQLD